MIHVIIAARMMIIMQIKTYDDDIGVKQIHVKLTILGTSHISVYVGWVARNTLKQ